MQNPVLKLVLLSVIISSCVSKKELTYFNNLAQPFDKNYFVKDLPDYKLQSRDIIYLSLKAMGQEGTIIDYLGGSGGNNAIMQSSGGSYLLGYNIDKDGNIILPVVGSVHIQGNTLYEVRSLLQAKFNNIYKNAVLECKLLSYKFTVIGEVKSPGTYTNYSSFLTVLEAIGQAGGINDYGKRRDLLIIRTTEDGTKTFTVDLQDKNLLATSDYFILPNDVIIVQPQAKKIFNLNFPTFSSVFTMATSILSTTLLLINLFGK